MTQTAKKVIENMVERLAQTSSDPQWITDDLNKAKALLDLEDAGAIPSGEPLSPRNAKILADKTDTLTYSEVASIACMQELVGNVSGLFLHQAPTEDSLRTHVRRLAQIATICGQELRNVRAVGFIAKDQLSRADGDPLDQDNVIPDNEEP